MLTAVCWKWGGVFGHEYVNRLRAALDRHLHLDHELICVTDETEGLDGDIRVIPLPESHRQTPRCRRRMRIFDREFAAQCGRRLLAIDLDVVIVDDLTPIVNRTESFVGWKVQHAGVLSGSFFLMNAGVLHGLWERFDADPDGFPRHVQAHGVPSDQAMLNYYLKSLPPVPFWTERDGFVTYFGKGYEKYEHLGVGPNRPTLPKGARIVVLGSADKAVMDEARFPWIREHWVHERVAA